MTQNTGLSRRTLLTSAAGVAAFAGVATLAGCAPTASKGGASAIAKKAKAGTLTIMANTADVTKDMIASFESSHPHLKIRLINYDDTRINAMLAAGSPPDLVENSGIDITPYYASRGIATNLDPYFAQSTVIKESDILPINDAWRWDGTAQGKGPRYGMAKDWSQDSMWWYNSDAWKAVGLTEPDPSKPITYDELLDSAKQLTQTSGGKTSRYGLFNLSPAMDIIEAMAATAGGRVLTEGLDKADFSSPEVQRVLKWFLDASKANVSYSPLNPSPDWDGPEFFAGKQVNVQQGYWFNGFLQSTAPKLQSSTKFAAAPTLGSKRVSPSFGAVGFWVPSKAANPGAGFEFLEWFCAGAEAKTRAKAGGGLPSIKSLLSELPSGTPFTTQALTVQKAELDYLETLPLASPYALAGAMNAVLTPAFTAAATNGTSAAKLGDTLTTAVTAVLANGKVQLGK